MKLGFEEWATPLQSLHLYLEHLKGSLSGSYITWDAPEYGESQGRGSLVGCHLWVSIMIRILYVKVQRPKDLMELVQSIVAQTINGRIGTRT